MNPLITVVTPTTGAPCLDQAIESVQSQTYPCVQHLVVMDGDFPNAETPLRKYARAGLDVIRLPFNTGANRFNGHLIYGASSYLAKGEYLCFLDEDNWLDADHLSSLMEVIVRGNSWAFSLRKIYGKDGHYVCNDDCESLGKWPSCLNQEDYFIDVGCYFLPKNIAVQTSPIWNRKAREPNVPEVDRVLSHVLRNQYPGFDTNGRYSLNYRTGNTNLSVQKEFFLRGNDVMSRQYNGVFPWRKAS